MVILAVNDAKNAIVIHVIFAGIAIKPHFVIVINAKEIHVNAAGDAIKPNAIAVVNA